jgi:hypothetical protein
MCVIIPYYTNRCLIEMLLYIFSMQICSKYRGAQRHFRVHCRTHHQSVSKGLVAPIFRGPSLNKQSVVEFLCRDDNSRMTAGKKQCRTYRGIKEQIRYLNHSMDILYEKWCTENGCDMSRSSFYQMRPFYVLRPRLSDREQCLCGECANLQVIFLS